MASPSKGDDTLYYAGLLERYSSKLWNARWTKFVVEIRGKMLELREQPGSAVKFKVNLSRCDLLVEGELLLRPLSTREREQLKQALPRFIFTITDQRTRRLLRLGAEVGSPGLVLFAMMTAGRFSSAG